MAQVPIEIVNLSVQLKAEMRHCIKQANEIQDSIHYTELNDYHQEILILLEEESINTVELFDGIESIREKMKGFHPHIIVFTDKALYNEYYNIYGSSRGEAGLGVFTTNNVSDTILPLDKISAYITYYLARYALNFLHPKKKNHPETKNCIYDTKLTKLDILKSMRKDPFCEDCRASLLSRDSKVTIDILNSLNLLFAKSGELLNDGIEVKDNKHRTSIFISYAHADEEWKNKLKLNLKPLENLGKINVWADDRLKPGTLWFDEIRTAMEKSKIGILLISPDFLASDFINHVEIPQLLLNVEREGGKIFPVILRHSLFTRMDSLSKFQATNPPNKPIASLSSHEQDAIFVKIAEDIWDILEEK